MHNPSPDNDYHSFTHCQPQALRLLTNAFECRPVLYISTLERFKILKCRKAKEIYNLDNQTWTDVVIM
jgi:hypothetical protein